MCCTSVSWSEPSYAKERKTSEQLVRRPGCEDFEPDVQGEGGRAGVVSVSIPGNSGTAGSSSGGRSDIRRFCDSQACASGEPRCRDWVGSLARPDSRTTPENGMG